MTENSSSIYSPILTQVREIIAANKDLASKEGPENSPQRRTNQGLDIYEKYFTPLERRSSIFGLSNRREPRPITRFLEERRERHLPRVVLDLFAGEGVAVRDMSRRNLIKEGLIASLSDNRNPRQRAYDQEHNIGMVAGDLFELSTWRRIEEWLEGQQRKWFDLITALPVSAYRQKIRDEETILGKPIPAEAYGLVLKRALRLLNPEGGMLLAQVPFQLYSPSDRYVPDARKARENLRRFRDFLDGLCARLPGKAEYVFTEDLSLWSLDPECRVGVVVPSHCGFLKITRG